LDTGEGKKMFNEKYKKTNRRILIDHGQEKRDIDKNYWVDLIIKQIKERDGLYVISDWRFENEYTCIRNEFKKRNIVNTIRINRFSESSIKGN
jgi:hypothetical protein